MAQEDTDEMAEVHQLPAAVTRIYRFPWERTDLIWGDKGLKPTAANAVTILQRHPLWEGTIVFDVFQRSFCWAKKPPFGEYTMVSDAKWGGYPMITDSDVLRIRDWFQRKPYGINLAVRDVEGVVALVGEASKVNSLREKLEDLYLQWDEKPRIGDPSVASTSWLSTYLKVDEADVDDLGQKWPSGHGMEYLACVGRWWLLSLVQRAFKPGCIAQYCLVLEGPQGVKKTTALDILSLGHHLDTHIDLDNKEAYMLSAGSWVQEFGEGDAMRRASVQRIKQFLTERYDEYVPKFANRKVKFPRMWVGVITINPDKNPGYLKDPTGNRRFWPVPMNSLPNFRRLEENVEQLWGEAVAIFLEGEKCIEHGKEWAKTDPAAVEECGEDPLFCLSETLRCRKHRWWPTPEEEQRLLVPVQRSRAEESVIATRVIRFLLTVSDEKAAAGIPVEHVMAGIFLDVAVWEREKVKVSEVMATAGWEKVRRKPGESSPVTRITTWVATKSWYAQRESLRAQLAGTARTFEAMGGGE